MCINFLLILVFGSLPLFLLMLLCVKVLRDKPAEQDVAFRLFFVTLLCLPCLAALLPRWTTVAMDFSARAGTAIDVTESAEEDVRSEIEKNIVAQRPETIRQDTVSMTFEPDFLPMNPRISETPAPDISMPTPVARSKTAEIRTVEPDPMETVLPIVQSPQIDETSSDEMRNPLRQHVANWIPPVFFMIWLIGLMRGVWLFLHSRSVYAEILREAEPLEKYSWVDLCRELETALQLKQPIEYRVSDTVDVPQVLGLWQPVVLLPKHLVDETPNRAVLIHELAHIRRRDIAWQMLMNVVCMIYWFQPLIRFFVTAMRTVREELCDDYVLRFGEKGSDYAATLLDLSSLVQRGHRLPERIGCAVTMPSQQNQIERRILSLLDPDRKRGPIPMKTKLIMITGMVTTALLCVAICPALESRSNDENPDETSTGTAMPDVPQATIVVDENRQSKTPETDGGYVTDLQSIGVQPVPAIHVGESTVPFRGAVQWEDGTPVVGADVTVLMPGNESLVLKSDANGRFLLWTCPTSRWNQSIRMIARCEKENGGETYIGFRKTDKEDKEYRIVLKPGRTLHGTVTGSSGTTPELFTVGSSEYGFTSVTGKSDFALVVPADELPERICAWADQEGFTYRIIPNDQNREESVNDPLYVEPDQPINLTLEGVAPLTIRAIDTDGTGLSGIEFEIWGIAGPPQMVDGELKTRSQFTWPQPIRTDENGIATIVSFPDWVNGSLTIRPVQFHDGPARYVRTKEFWPNIQGQPALFVQEFIKNVPVRGRVAYPDGNPVVGLELRAVGQGLTLNDRWNFTTTDDDGRYEFLLPPYQWYLMAAKPVDDWAFPMQDGFAIVPGEPVEDFDIVMEPVRDVTIQVLHVPGETPLADRKLRLAFQGRSDHDIERIGLNPVPEKFHLPIYRGMQANQFLELTRGEFTTDAEGRVTVPLGPGRYRYELLEREKDFFGVVGDFEIPQTSQQRDTIRIRVPNEEESLFSGKVLRKNSDGQTKPAVGVKVVHNDPPVGRPGKSDKDNRAGEGVQTDDNGEFSFTRVNKSMRVLAYDRKTKEAVHTNISAMQPTVTLELKPLVSVTGRIINLETGEPIAEALLEYRFRYEFEGDISCGRNWMNPTDTERMFYQTIMTDESGRFTIDGLLAGEKYDLHYDRATETNERFDYWQIGGFRTPQSTDGTPFDVGAIRVASVRPIGLRDVDPDSQRREAGNTGGIADLLRDARRERDAIYAWSRIVSYKNAILRLLEQNQMDAAKSVGTEMLELLVSTRKTLKERNIPYHEGRHDEELHAVAIAFEENG